MKLDGDRLTCEFSVTGSQTKLLISLRPFIRVNWSTLVIHDNQARDYTFGFIVLGTDPRNDGWNPQKLTEIGKYVSIKLLFVLLCFSFFTACETIPGTMRLEGFVHEQLRYSIPFAQPDQKIFINEKWKLTLAEERKKSTKRDYGTFESTSNNGHQALLHANRWDLFFRHKETNGFISIQSFPITREEYEKKLDIHFKDQVDRLNSKTAKNGKSMTYTIISSKISKMSYGEILEAVLDLSFEGTLKNNPDFQLRREKLIFIRPEISRAWRRGEDESFPALMILNFSMDSAYFNEYVADFDNLVTRIRFQ